ncbi:MAG: hypothetical protein H5T44_04460 [Thermoplasmatales archaeon]|nr:hypothetical protein [Thermoplasmatales archaeon]
MKSIIALVVMAILLIPSNYSSNIKPGNELPSAEDIFSFFYLFRNKLREENFFTDIDEIPEIIVEKNDIQLLENSSLCLVEAIKEFYETIGVEYEESKIEEFANSLHFKDIENFAISSILYSYTKTIKSKNNEERNQNIFSTIEEVRKYSFLLMNTNFQETKFDCYGKIAFGGVKDDYYKNYIFIIDFGGNDFYDEGNSSFILDLKGSDHYKKRDSENSYTFIFDMEGDDYHNNACYSSKSFSFLFDLKGNDSYYDQTCVAYENGTSLLIDFSGNDLYEGKNFTQAFSSNGVAVLIDIFGDDTYISSSHSQSSSIYGFSSLIDLYGNDVFYSSDASQSYSDGITSFSFLLNLFGDDFYKSGNYSQGYANGGYAIFFDFSGEDGYEVNHYSQSCSIFGLSIFADTGGKNSFSHGLFCQGKKLGGIALFLDKFEINDDLINIIQNLKSNVWKFLSYFL